MASVREILQALEKIAPRRYAASWDKIGLQVGEENASVERAVVSLDRSLGAVKFAKENRASLLLAHHPLIFAPIGSIDSRRHDGRTILELIRSEITFVAAHTNWDASKGGINDTLAKIIGLQDVSAFGMASDVPSLKLIFFCPPDSADNILDAVSDAGAGVIGAYSRCAFFTRGTGTFIGDETTNPTIGQPGVKESVDELRVETVLPQSRLAAVLRALRLAHPYEEPAYDLVPMHPMPEQPTGRMGSLPVPMTFHELTKHVDGVLATRSLAWGQPEKRIRKVAVVGGAADSEWMNAQRSGADVLITGEVKQHIAIEASESGMCLLSSGHYATEHPGCSALRDVLSEQVPDVEWILYTPDAGLSGRPFSVG